MSKNCNLCQEDNSKILSKLLKRKKKEKGYETILKQNMGKIKVIKRELKDKRLVVPIEYKPISERLTEMLTAKFRPGNPLEFEDTARDYQCLNQTNEQVTSP